MKKLMYLGLVLFFLTKVSASEEDKFIQKIHNYHDSITILNLFNGIHITAGQCQKLLQLNKDFIKTKQGYLNRPTLKTLKENAEKDLLALQDYLLSNPEQENAELHEKAVDSKRKFEEYLESQSGEVTELYNGFVKRAKSIFSNEQLQIINTFKPCIIPPQDIRDPIKAGQASSNSPVETGLDKLRLVRDKQKLNEYAEMAANKLIEATNSYYYKMTPEEAARKKNEIIQTIKYANAMSDTEYELKKDEFVKKLSPEDKIKKMADDLQKLTPLNNPFRNIKDSPVKKYLLDSDILIPILEKRLSAAEHGGLK